MRKVITLAASAAVALSLFGCASSLPNTAKAGNASLGYPDGWTETAPGSGFEVLGVEPEAAVIVQDGKDASFVVADMPDGEMPVSAVEKAARAEATEVGGKPAVKLTAYADGAATVIVAVGDDTVDGIMVATMAGYDENREKYDEVMASFRA